MAGPLQWIRKMFFRARGQAATSRGKPRNWDRYLLQVERLEDRLAPANTINVIVGTAGTGQLDHYLSATNGTILATNDPGATETLSTGALAAVGAGVTISITAVDTINFSSIGSLTLQTGGVASASFTANLGAITFANVLNTLATSGAGLDFSAGSNLTVANLSTGLGAGGVSLVAGTAGAGDLQFGGVANSGLNSLTVQATNAAGGSITQSGTTSVASGSTVNISATNKIALNSVVGVNVSIASTFGAIVSSGSLAVQAFGPLTLSAGAGINLITLAGSVQASNAVSGNISISQNAGNTYLTTAGSGIVNSAPGGSIAITNLGGAVTVTGAANGNGGTLNAAGTGIQSNNGAVAVEATAILIAGTIVSGTATTTLGNSVAGAAIGIGSSLVGGINLSQAELDQITAGELIIGTATAGNITINAAITSTGTGWNKLALVNGGTITEAAAGSLSVPSLRVDSAGPDTLTSVNVVGTLAAHVANAFSFSNGANPLTVGDVDGDAGVTATNATIDLIGDAPNLAQPVNAGSGRVIIAPFTVADQISLGGNNAAGVLGVSDLDLGQVTAGVLQIGNSSVTGGVTVSNGLTRHAGFTTLDLVSGTTVGQTAALAVANLAVQAAGNIALTNAGNAVDIVAAATAGSVQFTNTIALTVGTVGSLNGIVTNGGVIVVLLAGANDLLTIAQPIDATNAEGLVPGGPGPGGSAGGANITLTADNMAIDAEVTAGTSIVTLKPFTSGQLIGLGSTDANGTLGLTNNEMGNVSAGIVRVGSTASGNIAVTKTIDVDSYATLSLITGGGITESSGAVLSVANLCVSAANSVLLTQINLVGTFAAAVSNSGQPLSFLSQGNLTVGTVDSVAGITTSNGTITVTIFGPDPVTLADVTLTINNNIAAGNAAVLQSSTGLDSQIVNSAAITGSSATLTADRMALQNGTINVGSAETNIVTLQPFSAGRSINLDDTVADPTGELRLSNAELNTITAGTLRIGSKTGSQNLPGPVPLDPDETAGPADAITLESPIAPANVAVLSLLTDGAISQSANTDTISVANLDLSAGAGVNVTGNNLIATIAGVASNLAAPFTFDDDSASLMVAGVDTVAGIVSGATGNLGGPIQVAVNNGGLLNVAAPIIATGADIFLQANNMSLNAAITAGTSATNPTSVVSLHPAGSGVAIDLGGTNGPNVLGLQGADLNQVHANVLRIGAVNVPDPINVVGSVTAAPSTFSTLSLLTAAGVNEAAGTLTVNGLDVVDNAGVPNAPLLTSVGTFAANVGKGGVAISNSSSALTIDSVDGINGVTASGGAVTITTGAALTVNQAVTTSGAVVNLTGRGAIIVNVTGPTPLNINGLGSANSYVVNLGALKTPVNVNGAGTGTDVLVINGPASADTYTVSGAQVIDQHNQTVNYANVSGVAINAGNAGNLFNVQGITAGEPVTLNTGNGSNAVNVGNAGTLAGFGSPLTLNGPGPTSLTVNDQNDLAGETYNLSDTGIAGAVAVSSTGVNSVTVNGGAGSDTFNVTPSAATTFNVNGNLPNPPANPGDTLTILSTGTLAAAFNPATGYAGAWTFASQQPVNFTDIETLTGTDNLAIGQTDNSPTPGSAVPGTNLTYTVTVQNTGTNTVAGASVTDVLPAACDNASYTTTLSAGASDTNPSGAGNISDNVSLPPGATIVYTIVGTIDHAAVGTLSNTATVSPPPSASNSNSRLSATNSVTLVPTGHVVVTVTTSPSSPQRGSLLVYIVTIVNQGPSDATGAILTDTLPAGASYQVANFSQGSAATQSGGTVTVNLGTIASGGTATGTIAVVPAFEGTTTNVATVAGNSVNPSPGDATATTTVSVANTQVIWTGVIPFNSQQGVNNGLQALATFIDPAGPEALSSYSATVNWGDGQTSAGTVSAAAGQSFIVSGAHAYAQLGQYTVTITAHHNLGPDTTITTNATVVDPPLRIATLSPPLNIGVARGFVGLLGTFVDPDPVAVAGDFIVGLYWGDNTYSLGSVLLLGPDAAGEAVFAVYGFHTYYTAGHYTFSMGVYAQDGSFATLSTPSGGTAGVNVYTPTAQADLVAYNANLVFAQQQEQYYSSLYTQQQANYQVFLAAYWQNAAQQNLDAYDAVAIG